jgi:(E)-4-hydroxy-3-methylbut-2-enyl-diphosphate synthase
MSDNSNTYCIHPFQRKRLPTLEVTIGNTAMGGENPIRIQSMTTTDTMNTKGSVEQSIRMIEAGCELVRLTAPSKKEAANLSVIREELAKLGYTTPLVADIHFTPNAAEIAAKLVQKVRVNPGNYADKKKFEDIEYTDESYNAELLRIEEKFTPLIHLCKEHGTAMRIGTNHGSLSDRILSRYGDTPLGMVESAFEFIRICQKYDYHELVISMKASNTLVMVQAYRLLVSKMLEEGKCYPLHLGVTEAGDGEDGRIKSAVGIGALLEDGIGDTVRVSLTEEPEYEIPVAQKLVQKFANQTNVFPIEYNEKLAYSPYVYSRRDSNEMHNIGHKSVPVVVADLSSKIEIKPAHLFAFGYRYSVDLDKWNLRDQAVDYLFIGDNEINFEVPGTLGVVVNEALWSKNYSSKTGFYPLSTSPVDGASITFVKVDISKYEILSLSKMEKCVFVLECTYDNKTQLYRKFINELTINGLKTPIVFKQTYQSVDEETFQLYSSSDLGSLFIDGFGDGIWLNANQPAQIINSTSFGILQATRTRISKTEYISCPSCGRTLFDLQETTTKIRKRTSHLKGIKIGIMGCIVNGPGEMADADYGYVGTGPGKITLYKEREVVKKNIPEFEAVDALVNLIKDHGDWIEPALESSN